MQRHVKLLEEMRTKTLTNGYWTELGSRPSIEEQVEQLIQNGAVISHVSPPGFEVIERTPERMLILTGLVVTYERPDAIIQPEAIPEPVESQVPPSIQAGDGPNIVNALPGQFTEPAAGFDDFF